MRDPMSKLERQLRAAIRDFEFWSAYALTLEEAGAMLCEGCGTPLVGFDQIALHECRRAA